MNLAEYLEEAIPLTRENFIRVLRKKKIDPKAFNKFCKRMKKEGGYGALD